MVLRLVSTNLAEYTKELFSSQIATWVASSTPHKLLQLHFCKSGRQQLLGEVIQRCLNAEGLGLIHSIGQNDSRPLNPWIERNIFPGAYPPTLGEMMEIFVPHRFSILDVENLRLHYAQT